MGGQNLGSESRHKDFIPRWAKGVVLILVVATACYFLLDRTNQLNPTVRSDGTVVAEAIVQNFEKMGDLRVSRISGNVQGVGYDPGTIFPSRYVMKAPFEASYFIDLSKIRIKNYRWDEQGKTLIINVPDVRLDSVNVDETRKSVDQTTGWWVTKRGMQFLREQATVGAASAARTEAMDPKWFARARRQGRDEISIMYGQPLRVAGVNARIRVHYAGEPGDNDEQMDRSRSIAEILGLP